MANFSNTLKRFGFWAGGSFIVLIFLVPVGASAQSAPAGHPPPCNPTTEYYADYGGSGQCEPNPTCPSGQVVYNGSCIATTATGAATQVAQGVGNTVGGVVGAIGDGLLKIAVVPIAYLIFTLCAWLLGIIGVLFNWAVIRTVFQFATFFGNSSSLLLAWGILRDIGNIILLFGFIFMGVSTILNLPSSEYTAKRALPALIIFAVLLNFSLFAAEAVIDVANGFSSTLATQAGQACDTTGSIAKCAEIGISGAIFQMTGVQGIFTPDVLAGTNLTPISEIGVFIILSLFLIITALVLLAGAIMLIMRAVVLVWLIITSPIGFAGMAVPPLHEVAKQWWHQLINQAFFAPVYILMMLISIKLAQGLGNSGNLVAAVTGSAGGTGIAGGSVLNLQSVLVLTLVLGFMIAALIAAKRMGAAGAGFATRTAGALTFGTVGFIGRRTAGAGANEIVRRIGSSKLAQTNPGLARRLETPFKKLSESSMSLRGVATNLGKGAHLDFGKPNKDAAHGFHGIEEKERKAIEDFEKRVRPTTEQMGTANEIEKELEDKRKELEANRTQELAEVQEQRKKVAQARLAGDEEALDVERRMLADKISAYENKNNTREGREKQEYVKKLEDRLKYWQGFAEREKSENFIEGLHNQVNIPVIEAAEKHAAHEAARNIRKNAGKSKVEKALEALKEEGGGGAPPAAAAPAGGGDQGPAAH
jgi:hypothetical protein